MTDDLNPTDEVEEAPANEQEPTSEQTSEPDEGQDVGALKRALERERQERKEAKEELRRIREDEDARRAFLAELGYEIDEGEPDTEDDFDDEDEPDLPADPRVEKLLQWQQQQEAEKAAARFETDFKKFVGDRELSDKAERAIRLEASTGSMGPKELQEAIDSWVEYEEQIAARGRDGYLKSKKAPHVSPVGKSATKAPNLDDDQERIAHMAQRFADLEAS